MLCFTKIHPNVSPTAMSPNYSLQWPRMYLEGDVQMQLFCLIIFLVLIQPLSGITLRNGLLFIPSLLIQRGAIRN